MFTIDGGTKRQFVRDFKLPINIVDDNYFEYYLDLYQEHFGSREKYDLFLKTAYSFKSLDDFVAESVRIRREAVEFIQSQPAYEKLSKDDLKEYQSDFSQKVNLYNHLNVGKRFISIDMVKANVQALNFYDKDILQADNYEEFLGKFTEHDYFKKSKQIRQVIFGTAMPKKQQRIQKYIMSLVKSKLISSGVRDSDIYASSPDELVFDADFFDIAQDVLKDEELQFFDFHLDVFSFNSIKCDLSVFIKRFENKDDIEIKMGNSKYMAEVVKYLKNEPISHFDLCFMDEGRIAQYLEPIILKED